MRQGCRQAANSKRARHSRRATKTCRNKDKQSQADTIASRALCVPPHGCCVLSAPRLQVHSHRCPLARHKMHKHWLHVYQCSQTRCKPAGAHRPGPRCTGARRPGSGHVGAHRPGSPQARLQVQTCRCLPQARFQVCRCQQARLQINTCCRMGCGSVYTCPPTSYTTQPMGSGHPSKASHSQCRPGLFPTASLFTRTHCVRVPALSAGVGGSSTFVHAVPQQVLKQAEIQSFIGSQVLLTPFVASCQTLPRVSLSQTPRSFRFFQILDECLAADHRYLVMARIGSSSSSSSSRP